MPVPALPPNLAAPSLDLGNLVASADVQANLLPEQPVSRPLGGADKQRTLPFLLVVLAFALRLLHAPVHVALEEHLNSEGHLLEHALAAERHSVADQDHEDHEHGHEHDHDHPPHPAGDHYNVLIAQRTPIQQAVGVLLALPPDIGLSLLAPLAVPSTVGPEPKPPRHRPARTMRPRGPPATA